MVFTGLGRRLLLQKEGWRIADDELDSIMTEVAKPPHAPCSPLDRICVIGVCMSRFCVVYPFAENATDEKKKNNRHKHQRAR